MSAGDAWANHACPVSREQLTIKTSGVAQGLVHSSASHFEILAMRSGRLLAERFQGLQSLQSFQGGSHACFGLIASSHALLRAQTLALCVASMKRKREAFVALRALSLPSLQPLAAYD